MAKKKKRIHDPGDAEPPMSAMIDVVFLLLIFFIVTYVEPAVEAHMAINMPSPSPPPPSPVPPPPPLEIWVLHNRYLMMGTREAQLDTIEDKLYAIVANNPKQAVMIKVQQNATEGKLIDLLDRCAKVKLANLNVLTLKEGYNETK